MNAKKIALFLPATLLCLSASSPPEFYWSVGPLTEGDPSIVRIKALCSSYATCWWFVDANNAYSHVTETRPVDEARIEGQYYVIEWTIPSDCFRHGYRTNLHFGLAAQRYTTALDFSKIYLNVYETITPSKSENAVEFYGDEIQELERSLYIYNPDVDPSRRIIYHEGYRVLDSLQGNDLSGRRIPIENLSLDYVNPHLPPRKGYHAVLRMITHHEEFNAIGEDRGYFTVIPLDTTIRTVGYGTYRYTFAPQAKYYVSRVDYHSYAIPPDNVPCFLQKGIYLPLREKHDGATYDFTLVLYDAGYYGDEIRIHQSAFSSRSLFGPCGEAEYCVVGR